LFACFFRTREPFSDEPAIIRDADWSNPNQYHLLFQALKSPNYYLFLILIHLAEYKVRTVEEQVRASAEHKLGVANQSITAGFFDNNTR
jgi:hypothetical protein